MPESRASAQLVNCACACVCMLAPPRPASSQVRVYPNRCLLRVGGMFAVYDGQCLKTGVCFRFVLERLAMLQLLLLLVLLLPMRMPIRTSSTAAAPEIHRRRTRRRRAVSGKEEECDNSNYDNGRPKSGWLWEGGGDSCVCV